MKLATLVISASLLAAPAFAEQCASKKDAHRVNASYTHAIAGEGYEERIFLQGDTNAAYGEVLSVMTQMKNAGFTNIALVTDPKARVGGDE